MIKQHKQIDTKLIVIVFILFFLMLSNFTGCTTASPTEPPPTSTKRPTRTPQPTPEWQEVFVSEVVPGEGNGFRYLSIMAGTDDELMFLICAQDESLVDEILTAYKKERSGAVEMSMRLDDDPRGLCGEAASMVESKGLGLNVYEVVDFK